LLLAPFVRRRATLEVGLCPTHRRSWTREIVICWSAAVGFLVLALGAYVVWWSELRPLRVAPASVCALLFVIIGLSMLLELTLSSTPVVVSKIDDSSVWLKGIGKDFLASFQATPSDDPAPRTRSNHPASPST
jgi:hypothetical protein